MTENNPYQIGATDKPKSSFFQTNKNQNPRQQNAPKSTPNNNPEKPAYNKTKPINKNFNSKKPFNKNQPRQPFNRNSSKSFNNGERKPFNRNDRKPFNRDDKKPFDRKPFNKDDKKPYERKPFNRDDKKPFNRDERKPFNRDQRKPFERNDRKPFERNDRKPFNRNDRKPFQKNDRNDRQPFKSERSTEKNNKQESFTKNIKHQEKQLKQTKQQVDQNIQNTNSQKVQAKTQKPKALKIKHNRVIVRNLVFDISATHLKKLLSPFGEIEDVHIPLNPDGKGSRGFAFIEFKNRNNALKAIKQLNGTMYKGRTIVLDESISKQKYLESKIDQEDNENEENKIQQESKSKVKLQAGKKQKLEMESQNQNEENVSEDDQDEQNEEEDSEDDQEDKKVKSKGVKKQGNKRQKTESQILEDISSEVFIRNLPISVDEKALHSFFRRYGKLKFAKVVVNKQTGLSKGSAFLKFEDPLKAKQLVDYSRDYEMSLLGKNPNFKTNAGINFQLEGTVLKLFPVESRVNISEKIKGRDEKDAKREEQRKEIEKKKKPLKKVKNLQKLVEYDPNDKRNLKLALLGINKVTQQMREKDQERFINHGKEKLAKLKNPNNSVCDKRIIIKFLDKDITESDIRSLCVQYLEATSHKAHDLTYCKLMLESLESKKSAGFAFIEFKTPQIAVAFLQWIANEPKKLQKQPFVCQFAIQDSRKLQKIHNKNSHSQSTAKKPQNKKGRSMSKNKDKKSKDKKSRK